MRCLLAKHHWKIVNLLCFIAFSWQFYDVVHEWISPSQTTVSVMEKNLREFEFPVIFKICMNPGFDSEALREAGYTSSWHYFKGSSKFNSSIYGWAGHKKDKGIVTFTI